MIKVVDLFAGPGGLGEGFARFSPSGGVNKRPFSVVFSAEKDAAAVKTLRLRTFYRLCESRDSALPRSYFEYLRGKRSVPYDLYTENLWFDACREASPLELGTKSGDAQLKEALKTKLQGTDQWILIGGPPCQAYSIVGRSRNRGIADYDATRDHRNFLYEHYLDILARHQPVAFIMENVKGLLSSRVGNQQMFPRILNDLANPGKSAGTRAKPKYIIYALATDSVFSKDDDVSDLDPRAFLIRSEEHGIPQARHRVILLGVRADIGVRKRIILQPQNERLDSWLALRTLPPLRSGLSKTKVTTSREWLNSICEALQECRKNGLDPELAKCMEYFLHSGYQDTMHQGAQFVPVRRVRTGAVRAETEFLSSITHSEMAGYPNHEARGHMPMDLVRYLYASTYAASANASPTASDFPHTLAPNHKNWDTGKFADRFRVQVKGRPSTTITSHISKDGHYFIHPEPFQCRSLTVREAARLQTFPDDYFFEGNRTQQYVQVGNAVPPMLAEKIAGVLWAMLSA